MITLSDDNQAGDNYNQKNIDTNSRRLPKAITEKYLYNSGLAYLQRFPTSSMNFKKVMRRKIDKSCHYHTQQDKTACYALLDKITEQFIRQKLLDDSGYLQGMVYSLRNRGLSALHITLKLQQKGYDRSQIHLALSSFDEIAPTHEYNGDLQAAMIFARKKSLGPYDKAGKKDPKKSIAMMARSGFSYDIIQKVLRTNLEELYEETL